jgi:hypothetical protein
VTYDGKWILGTTDTYLILICTIFIDKDAKEKTRFSARMGHRIAAPRPLTINLLDSHLAGANNRLREVLTATPLLLIVTPITVQVARGKMITCCHHLPSGEWTMLGCHFSADRKFLTIPTFDLVVSRDWLQRHIPMKVDRNSKWLVIQYQGTTRCLQGLLSSFPVGARVELRLSF